MNEKKGEAYQKFLLRLPFDLLNWYRQLAKKNRRSVTAELIIALEYCQKEKKEVNNDG